MSPWAFVGFICLQLGILGAHYFYSYRMEQRITGVEEKLRSLSGQQANQIKKARNAAREEARELIEQTDFEARNASDGDSDGLGEMMLPMLMQQMGGMQQPQQQPQQQSETQGQPNVLGGDETPQTAE